jgi:hypothetical protein
MRIAGTQLVYTIGNDTAKKCWDAAKSRNVIYHHTNLEALTCILKDKCLKFSRIDKVNDIQENEFFMNEEIAKLVYVSSFSYGKESIPMWSMYTSRREGVRIGLKINKGESFEDVLFDKTRVVRTSNPDYTLSFSSGITNESITDKVWKVSISSKDISYDASVAQDTSFIKHGDLYDMNNMALVKDEAWGYEEETRFAAILRTTQGEMNDESTWVDIPDYNYLLVPITFDNICELEITFSPWRSDAIKDVIRLIVEKYGPEGICKFNESDFYKKVR